MRVLVDKSKKAERSFCKAGELFEEIPPDDILVVRDRELNIKRDKNDSQGVPRIFLSKNKGAGTIIRLGALLKVKMSGIKSYKIGGMEIVFLSGPKCF